MSPGLTQQRVRLRGMNAETSLWPTVPDGVRVFGAKATAFVLGAVTAIILARGLAPDARGIWAVCMFLAGLVAILSEVGVGTAATVLVARSHWGLRTIASTSFALTLCLTLVAVAFAAIVVSTSGDRLLPGVPLSTGVLACLASPFVVLTNVGRQIALASGRLAAQNWSVVLQAFLLCAFVVLGLTLPGKPMAGLVLLYVVGQALAALATVAGAWSGLPGRAVPDARLLPQLLRDGLKAYWATVALFLAYRADVLIVNYFVGPRGAGLYAIALTISEVLRGIPESAQALVLVRLRHPDLGRRSLEVCRAATVVTLVIGGALAVFSGWLVPLFFGYGYAPAAGAFVRLVPGVVALAVSYSLSPLLLRAGEIGVNAIAASAATVLMICLDIVLVPRLGIQGAALSSSVAYAAMTTIQVARLRLLGVLAWRDLCPTTATLTALLWWRPVAHSPDEDPSVHP